MIRRGSQDRLDDYQLTNLFIVLLSVMLKCDIRIFEKKLQQIGRYFFIQVNIFV